jgi:Mg2+-importing ATPase
MTASLLIHKSATKAPYQLPPHMLGGKAGRFSPKLVGHATSTNIDAILRDMGSSPAGLSDKKARLRLHKYGPNEVTRQKKKGILAHLWDNFVNPLVLLLTALGIVSWATDDHAGATVIFSMVVVGIVMRFYQEVRADHAAEKLRAMISTKATVIRSGKTKDVPLKTIVPGDIVTLSAGDMIPADVVLVSSKDLFVTQAALTGESMPVEKRHDVTPKPEQSPLEMANICFLGSNVESGSGTAVVINTGDKSYFGSLAVTITSERTLTSFDKGVNHFTWLMIRFMLVMVPAVFLINGFLKHDWMQAFLFAVAVAVGLTPEMLPMIVNVNLAKGAQAMAKKKVIVKRLNSIQNFGAMNILCTDKTGTLTQGRVILEKFLDARGNPSDKVLHYGYLNSFHHTGLKNLLDEAILKHEELKEQHKPESQYRKIDEIPFDFVRRRMSVVLSDETTQSRILICKGAIDEILAICPQVDYEGKVLPIDPELDKKRRQLASELNAQGFRVVAIAYKTLPDTPDICTYSVKDENNLTLLGFLAFLDPPKESAREAIKRLRDLNVEVKVLTGDNDIVASYICKQVGISPEGSLTGPQIEKMTDTELAVAASKASLFARLAPKHKERIIRALQASAHVVGFMGDGINDAPALKASDVGISVDSAVDIAKESSDIILLENSLLILEEGVIEGRKVFGNITKYIKMAASSNFGNVFSVVGSSAFLPFLPMLPLQILTNNMLYDFSQIAIPTDKVDEDWLKKPRKWAIDGLQKFILFIGPISSIFDYATFALMIWGYGCWVGKMYNPALFQTGWFIESLFTQTLIIHVIRTNKIPFIQSIASGAMIISSLAVVAIGSWLTVSPWAKTLGFVPLPWSFWGFLLLMLLGYSALTQLVKVWFIRKFGEE